jgi:hypothetical protein
MRLKSLLASLVLTTFLTGCVSSPTAQVSKTDLENLATDQGSVNIQAFAAGPAVGALRSNAEMASDFLDLEFRMESGRALPVLTRFEGPITIAMTGDVPPAARSELAKVVSRFQREAGLNVRVVAGNQGAITIDFRPKSALRRAVPSAACFVVPNVSSFDAYLKARGTATVDWTRITRREKVAVFVPSDTSPQEVRDCLHEELAQAMGPLNDLFRLSDSVFNDDNFHAVLTGFDMLMLRTHYAPELRSGMNEAEVAARLPAILARLNPAGQRISGSPRQLSPRVWISAAEAAFGATGSAASRPIAAERMLSIAKAQGWRDGRLAFSYFALGRAQTGRDMQAAVAAYTEAARIWRTQAGGQVHAAHVDMQLAAFALSSGQFDQAIALTDRAVPVVRQFQNASLLATLLAMRAEALDATGRSSEARAARLDSQGWARYAFGSDAQVRARLADISALARRGRQG